MKKKTLLTLSLLCGLGVSVVACTQPGTPSSSSQEEIQNTNPCAEEDNKVHLILMAGQSGGRGKALVSDLSEEERELNFDVDIIADGLDMPSLNKIPETIKANLEMKEVGPGYGDASSEFGPEIGMGQTLASRYPKDGESRKSVIVKYTACGSTFIADWFSQSLYNDEELSGYLNTTQERNNDKVGTVGPLTNNFYQLIDYTIGALEAEGYEAVIDGCTFIHGEQDTKFDDNMLIYEKALEYFVKDVRSYVGDEDLPFVITEALTNSGRYCNQLKKIQKDVTDRLDNCTLVTNEGLLSNTFEPWHFGKDSNIELGNRIAAEIIAYNDTRKVVSFEEKTINVPLNADVLLPKYLKAKFDNEYEGLIKVQYTSTYDKAAKGTYTVDYVAQPGCETYKGSLTVNVTDEPYTDGILNEYATKKANSLGDLGSVYVTKGAEGLHIAAEINDTDVWTLGESWHNGDMGQDGQNDDFRIYMTTGDAASRYTIALSAANLLRVYSDGTSFEDGGLPNKNMVYKKYLEEYYYRVTTKGLVNNYGGTTSSEGLVLELYIPYYNFNLDDGEDIKLCFNYNNVSNAGTEAKNEYSSTNNYLVASGTSQEAGLETLDSSYISINDLI